MPRHSFLTATASASRPESAITPIDVQNELPLTPEAAQAVENSREAVRRILDRADHRLLVVVGPCTIHDPVAGLDYARRLKKLADEVSSTLLVVMRVFLEKSLTTRGWKGYVNDPDLNESFDINKGLKKARTFLRNVNKIGLPIATEAVSPLSQQYYGDLITWTIIGVRSIESQTHREIASGLPTPVAFKNGTNGSLDNAINAIAATRLRHRFVTVDSHGHPCMIHTAGNPYGHLVLRGGDGRPNYDPASVQNAERAMRMAGLLDNIVVDCSHANSFGKPELQASVLANVIGQIPAGNRSLIGVMLESNLLAGNQKISEDRRQLAYGRSITDPCIDWETTETVIRGAAQALRTVLEKRINRPAPQRLPPI
jgi:3-deoxy-7-phosphoheptulonate synthase